MLFTTQHFFAHVAPSESPRTISYRVSLVAAWFNSTTQRTHRFHRHPGTLLSGAASASARSVTCHIRQKPLFFIVAPASVPANSVSLCNNEGLWRCWCRSRVLISHIFGRFPSYCKAAYRRATTFKACRAVRYSCIDLLAGNGIDTQSVHDFIQPMPRKQLDA